MSVTMQGGTDLQQEIAQADWFHIMDLGKESRRHGASSCMSPEQLEMGRLDSLTVLDRSSPCSLHDPKYLEAPWQQR